MDAQAGPMMKQLKNLGLTAKYLGGDGIQSVEFLKLAADAAEGAYGSSPGVPLAQMPGGKDFESRYKSKYNLDIQIYAPYAYDAANVLLAAMKKAGSVDPAKYLPELANSQYQGVTGVITFDEKGDIKGGGISLYQVKGGKWEFLETIGG
jgi:branched-chain amino acid transport system substrate-binding protein